MIENGADKTGPAENRRAGTAGWQTLLVLLALLCHPPAWPNGWEHHAIPIAALLRALHSEFPEYRARAAVSLGVKRAADAVPELIAVLAAGEPAPEARAAMYRALGRIGDSAARETLLTALGTEPRLELRSEAALALGEMADPASFGPLRDTLSKETEPGVRASLVMALGGFDTEQAVRALLAYTGDTDPRIRRLAVRSLGRTGTPAATVPLLAVLGAARDEATRISVVDALARIASPAARPALEALLAQAATEALKTHLVIALGAIRDGSTIPTLVALLDDGSPQQRYLALTALTGLGDARAAESIAAFYTDLVANLDALSDGGYPELADALTAGLRMQAAALRALHELDPVAGLAAFLHGSRAQAFPRDSAAGLRLNVLAFESRRLAISGLGYAGSESAFERLTDDAVWNDPDPRIRATAARAVAITGDPRADRLLAGRLADPEPAVRWTAAAALGRLRNVEAIEPLDGLLEDAHSEVRRQAVLSLALLDAVDTLKHIERLSRHDASDRVRRAAVSAVESLAGSGASGE